MADDKNLNEDPEENHFDDDEDFGLPDLEYDELDDEGAEPMDEEAFDEEIDLGIEEDHQEQEEELPSIEDSSESIGEESFDEGIGDDEVGSFDDSDSFGVSDTFDDTDSFGATEDSFDDSDSFGAEETFDDSDSFGSTEEAFDDADSFGSTEESFDDAGTFEESGSDDWEKELEKELEVELEAEGEADLGVFYEEESFDDFATDDFGVENDKAEVASSVFGTDESESYGAETDYPESESGETTYADTSYSSTYQQEEPAGNRGKFVRTVVIGTLAIAIVAFVFLIIRNLNSDDELPKKKVAQKETPAKKAPAKKPDSKKAAAAAKKEAENQEAAKKEVAKKEEAKKEEPKKEEPKAKPPVQKPAGEITSLTARTGKTYIVVGSFFDDDLAMDFAQKLSANSKSPIVIPPFGESQFYRVAIAEFNSFGDARAGIGNYKAEYGQDIWPLRY